MHSVVALLGHRDQPTDGVEDYCTFLGHALVRRGLTFEVARVLWFEQGWALALIKLWRESAAWRGRWVLLQYTALAWSHRGFPLGALAVLAVLRRSGVRVAVVFHEPERQTGSSPLQGVRGICQDWVIRRLYDGATKAIFADPLDTIGWLPKDSTKSAFIPIGANIPEPDSQPNSSGAEDHAQRTVAVFCISDPPNRAREVGEIAQAMRAAARNGSKLRLVLLGRGTAEAKSEIDRAFAEIPVPISNLGLLNADEVSRTLADSDVMLCVRGRLFPRRGSALAGVACGLPIVAYAGKAERTPLAEAGIALVPWGDRDALGATLARILSDPHLREELRRKSLQAHRTYFSWDQVAASFVSQLGFGEAES
jgi:glycosyltransferase involved in cell wall biosynthesis